MNAPAPADWRQRLILRWDALPTKPVLAPTNFRGPTSKFLGAPWAQTEKPGEPFDFSRNLGLLLEDVARYCPDLTFVQVPKILVTFTQARYQGKMGLQARVTPLRFPKGLIQRQRRGLMYQVQRYFHANSEFLYLMTFCLPRFLDQDLDEKLVTIFHELHHISPAFDGDLRRHEGRYHLHTHSQQEYDHAMAHQARTYLQATPNAHLHSFLRLTFAQLQERHGEVRGIVVPRPKLIPVPIHLQAAARNLHLKTGEDEAKKQKD